MLARYDNVVDIGRRQLMYSVDSSIFMIVGMLIPLFNGDYLTFVPKAVLTIFLMMLVTYLRTLTYNALGKKYENLKRIEQELKGEAIKIYQFTGTLGELYLQAGGMVRQTIAKATATKGGFVSTTVHDRSTPVDSRIKDLIKTIHTEEYTQDFRNVEKCKFNPEVNENTYLLNNAGCERLTSLDMILHFISRATIQELIGNSIANISFVIFDVTFHVIVYNSVEKATIMTFTLLFSEDGMFLISGKRSGVHKTFKLGNEYAIATSSMLKISHEIAEYMHDEIETRHGNMSLAKTEAKKINDILDKVKKARVKHGKTHAEMVDREKVAIYLAETNKSSKQITTIDEKKARLKVVDEEIDDIIKKIPNIKDSRYLKLNIEATMEPISLITEVLLKEDIAKKLLEGVKNAALIAQNKNTNKQVNPNAPHATVDMDPNRGGPSHVQNLSRGGPTHVQNPPRGPSAPAPALAHAPAPTAFAYVNGYSRPSEHVEPRGGAIIRHTDSENDAYLFRWLLISESDIALLQERRDNLTALIKSGDDKSRPHTLKFFTSFNNDDHSATLPDFLIGEFTPLVFGDKKTNGEKTDVDFKNDFIDRVTNESILNHQNNEDLGKVFEKLVDARYKQLKDATQNIKYSEPLSQKNMSDIENYNKMRHYKTEILSFSKKVEKNGTETKFVNIPMLITMYLNTFDEATKDIKLTRTTV